MDDEEISSGLSSLALYELGHLDGEVQRRHDNAVSAFSARVRGNVPVDVEAVLAENQALRQNNAALWQDVQDLRRWAAKLRHEIQRQYDNKCEWIAYGEAVAAERDILLTQKAARENDVPW